MPTHVGALTAEKDGEVQLDWQAYFYAFQEKHGEAVQVNNRLLYADGYQYSAHDYAGPEWQPPSDLEQLRKLRVTYWQRRRSIVYNTLVNLRSEAEQLRLAQLGRSVPLQRVVTYYDDDKLTTTKGEVNLTDLNAKVADLKARVEDCDKHLKDLQYGQSEAARR